ncbi:hypothetical protein L1987_02810 [Smallanthus sonchifolius]|uniref:Uncharacterized protein n=1 Tax=Smallanthus sonchifolius TaxID=185202 RepID=A0ACB9K903_9ASTR|nr:hypothetical protein L1987_02810 [Smallanthus sonchifolius]
MASIVSKISNVPFSPFFTLNGKHRPPSRVLVRSAGSENSVTVTLTDSVRIKGASSLDLKRNVVVSCDDGGKMGVQNVPEELKPLWDDGYGTQTIKDYAEIAMDLIKSDGGPPRWFCSVACGAPIKDSPVLLYLPGNRCFFHC